MDLYPWIVYLHEAGVLLFVLAHGVSVAVAFKIRAEREPARILAMLQLSTWSLGIFYAGILLLLAGGIWAGFTPGIDGSWWGQGWIWTALITFVLTMFAMYGVASTYYRRLRTIAQAMVDGSQAVSEERLAQVLAGPRAWILLLVGFGSLLFILYLMFFKPF
ncbi:MAG: hypothetical protein ACRDJP_02625 [Actinomycetota bacterium]